MRTSVAIINIEQKLPKIPEQFKFIQSTKQAFYFIENVTLKFLFLRHSCKKIESSPCNKS